MASPDPRPQNQRLVKSRTQIPVYKVRGVHESQLTAAHIQDLLASASSKQILGAEASYDDTGRLRTLCLATRAMVLTVDSYSHKSKYTTAPNFEGRKLLQDMVLANPNITLVTLNVHHLVLSLFSDMHIFTDCAIDLLSLASPQQRSDPCKAILTIMGDRVQFFERNLSGLFADLDPSDTSKALQVAVEKAWLCAYLGDLDILELDFQKLVRVDATEWPNEWLSQMAKVLFDYRGMNYMKPTVTTHNFSAASNYDGQSVSVTSSRYADKMRGDGRRTKLTQGGEKSFLVNGAVISTHGKNATVKSGIHKIDASNIKSITTIGREKDTQAEFQKTQTILLALLKKVPMTKNPWIEKFWNLPPNVDGSIDIPVHTTQSTPRRKLLYTPDVISQYALNQSQLDAVKHMLLHSHEQDMTVIQGPPGTGKTTVIAAFANSILVGSERTAWLVAKSNVAVKNIAEKLIKAQIGNWRLLVSSEFHLGWHEHLYNQFRENIITSDEISSKNPLPSDCRFVLCTLSMLGNARLSHSGYFKAVPLETLVVDEASQIEVGEYLPILSKFTSSLRKMCFIGDDKQLPPYGQETIIDLKSVFEMPHLLSSVQFLNVQYRMPSPIGHFISEHVYDKKLESNPGHPVHARTSCCFLNISDGTEVPDGTSWINLQEIKAVVEVATKLSEKGANYKIITPYDPQRSKIEEALKESGLDWHDRTFNVDSFQGNEEDFIIISLVRTKRIGFLIDARRTNVMLTRCKRGMYICANQAFLQGEAAETLVGRMAEAWKEDGWVNSEDLYGGKFEI